MYASAAEGGQERGNGAAARKQTPCGASVGFSQKRRLPSLFYEPCIIWRRLELAGGSIRIPFRQFAIESAKGLW